MNHLDVLAGKLEYVVECTLATVDDMCQRKRRPKAEFDRQIAIAQSGICALRDYEIAQRTMAWNRQPVDCILTGRVREVVHDYNANVAAWSNAQIARFEKPKS